MQYSRTVAVALLLGAVPSLAVRHNAMFSDKIKVDQHIDDDVTKAAAAACLALPDKYCRGVAYPAARLRKNLPTGYTLPDGFTCQRQYNCVDPATKVVQFSTTGSAGVCGAKKLRGDKTCAPLDLRDPVEAAELPVEPLSSKEEPEDDVEPLSGGVVPEQLSSDVEPLPVLEPGPVIVEPEPAKAPASAQEAEAACRKLFEKGEEAGKKPCNGLLSVQESLKAAKKFDISLPAGFRCVKAYDCFEGRTLKRVEIGTSPAVCGRFHLQGVKTCVASEA